MDNARTVDASETKFFNDMSTKWWKNSTKPLLSMNRIRIPYIPESLFKSGAISEKKYKSAKPLQGLNILDVGCGGGYVSEELARLGAAVVGLDTAVDLIEVAKQHATLDRSLTDLKYLVEAVEVHSKKRHEKYDVVVAAEVLDHVTEKELFLEHCVRCLKPGGTFVLSTISQTWTAWVVQIFLFEYILKIIPRGAHSLAKFITPQDTSKMLEKYNCKTTEVRGMFYNFITGVWYWWPCTWLTYTLEAIKL